jgi:hypothetical protein
MHRNGFSKAGQQGWRCSIKNSRFQPYTPRRAEIDHNSYEKVGFITKRRRELKEQRAKVVAAINEIYAEERRLLDAE